MHPCHHAVMSLTAEAGTRETVAPTHGLGAGDVERDVLDTFNDVAEVSLGSRVRA
jgi:hypothetical protein